MPGNKQEVMDILPHLKTKENQQKPLFGIGAGIIATFLGTILLILIAQKYRMPIMSIIVAFGIAASIRYAGNTRDAWYGIISAILSFIAATIGNIATGIAIFCVKYPSMTVGSILKNINFENILTLLQPVGWPMVLLSSIASLFVGFWFAFRHSRNNNISEL